MTSGIIILTFIISNVLIIGLVFLLKPLVNSFNNYKEKEDTYYKYLNSIYCVNEFKAAKEELFMKLVAFVLCLLLALFFLVITIDLASKL
ncbi:MAG: hypothetical protein IT239_04925 [Bacteroidia bacterium]|nr:hypothetical protein [Bacteroidia bacterium]